MPLGLHIAAATLLVHVTEATHLISWCVFFQVLDGQEAVPRLLKFRNGHSAPPVVVRHYADVSGWLCGWWQ